MDLQDVLKLLDLMESRHLDEIEVEQGGVRIRLKKAGATPPPAPVVLTPVAALNPQGSSDSAPAAQKSGPSDSELVKVVSPMVGTFYRSASPDAEPFVNEGDRIAADQVVCIIEAMKVMNEIRAEVEGEVVSILIENGESVEFGQPMLTIRRSGAAK
jgi:acetyl-CoA carboxylase biotin carboxyl carrier protein